MTESVVVVGGGLAGLVTARHLAADGFDVTVLEAHDTVGGRVRSRVVDGFTLDRGFQVLFTGYPAVRRELHLEALDLRPFSPGAVLARPGSRSVLADPFRDPRMALASLANPEVTFADKLRTLRLRRRLARTPCSDLFQGPDSSIREYLQDLGFSTDYIEHFAAPFLGGITLDRSLSTSKRVFEGVFKPLVEGESVLPAAGMGAVTQQLAEQARDAGATVRTGTRVSSVQASDEGATVDLGGETLSPEAVVVATDADTARELTDVPGIPEGPRGCVTLWFSLPRSVAPDGRRLLLNCESARPNQIAPHSAVAPEYAPDGQALFSATFLGPPSDPAETLADETRETLAAWYPARRFEDFDVITTDRIDFAQFDQPPGIHDYLPAVDAPAGRCYLAGEYTRWSSIQGAMESGRDAANAVRDALSAE